MSEAAHDLESLLREALAPVEPPEQLAVRLEATLASITEMAADELEAWELGAMRDPRNWARPAAALVVGTAAGTGLLILRARRRAQTRTRALGDAAEGAERALREHAGRAVRDLERETRRLLGGN